MKRTRFTTLLVIALALSFAATGCRKNPNNVKTIPGEPRTRVGDIGPGPGLPPENPSLTNIVDTIPLPDPERIKDWVPNAEVFKPYTVYFAYDSATLGAGERSKLASVADYMKGNPQSAVRVEGNCDERGTEEYNRSLGERRAIAAREELLQLGIESSRVFTKSWGEDNPANDHGHDQAAWKQNRRDDFILLTPPQQ